MMKSKLKFKTLRKKQGRIQIALDKLKEGEAKTKLEEETNKILKNSINNNEEVDRRWESIKKCL